MKKRAAIYIRVSTADQHPETQLYDLREMAKQRGYEIVHEYSDVISGAKSKRPGLDAGRKLIGGDDGEHTSDRLLNQSANGIGRRMGIRILGKLPHRDAEAHG